MKTKIKPHKGFRRLSHEKIRATDYCGGFFNIVSRRKNWGRVNPSWIGTVACKLFYNTVIFRRKGRAAR